MEATASNQTARTGKYPMIVVDPFPNLLKHLKSLKEYLGKTAYCQCRRNQIQFIPPDGPEYHAVVEYLNSIQITEPDMRYSIRPLNVCIRGLPSSLCIEDVKAACTERGYVVDNIKQITTNLCYVSLSGGKDNSNILEMRELLNYRVWVELWKSGPVRRQIEHREPEESVTSFNQHDTTLPPPRPEYSTAQSTSNQAASSEGVAAKYPSIIVETFPNLSKHLKKINEGRSKIVTCIQRHYRIRFLPGDAAEYHTVVQYMKSIEATEPGLKYIISPLKVTICGLPSYILTEDVKIAIREHGYLVDHVKQITPGLYYVKICGGNDNTKILGMEELFGYRVWIELCRSGPVRREMEPREPVESVTSSNINTETSVAPPTIIPEVTAVQSVENQTTSEERTEKYPAIVVETFPNWPRHLENIAKEFGRTAYAEAFYSGIRFVPRDGPEYHAVIRYLKSIEAIEPELKYVVRALDVCIYGLPKNFSTEDVKTACTELGYLVDHVKQIPTTNMCSLHYVKICGRKDNTKILTMRELLGYVVKVELWRGGPVKKEKKWITSARYDTGTSAPPATAVSQFTPEYQAGLAQSNQFPNSVSSASFLPLVPKGLVARSAEHHAALAPSVPPQTEHVILTGQSVEHQATAQAPPVPPHTEHAVLAGQSAEQQASPPPVPPRRSSLPVLAGQSTSQAPAAAATLPAITPEQMAALTAQITALTLTVFQIFGQPRSQ